MTYKGKEYGGMGEVFKLALKLAKENIEEAQEWLKEYIKDIAEANKCSLDEATNIAKRNLGYFAGYYDAETCKIIYNVYQCSHPIFGNKPFEVDPEEAYNIGLKMGKEMNLPRRDDYADLNEYLKACQSYNKYQQNNHS